MSRRVSLLRCVALVVVIVAGWVGLAASPASAHAELLATDPADGSVVATAPSELTLQFSESVSVRPDGVRVLDGEGTRVDDGEATSSGALVTAGVDDLAEGTYLVAWRALSADGHPVRGAFSFSVGRATEVDAGLADKAFGSGGDDAYEQLAAVLRVVSMVSILGASGVVLIGGALRRPDEPSPMGRATTWACTIGLLSLLLALLPQAALVTGRGVGSITESGVLGLSMGDGMGFAILLSSIGLLAMIITAGLPFEGAARSVAIVGAVVAPLGLVVYGHTRTMSPAVVAYGADAAHVLAGAVWLGGLLATVAIVRRRRHDGDPFGAAEAVATFSGWAAAIVAVLVVAGGILGYIEVGSLDALTSTTYGKLLIAKVTVGLVVVGLGGWNRLRLLPRVAAAAIEDPPSDDQRGWRTLVRTMRVEIGLLVVVLAITGVLVNVTPAKASVEAGPVSATADLGDGSIDVTVDPAQAGRNDIHLYLFDADGRPATDAESPTVQVSLPAQDLGPIDEDVVKVAPGHFQVVGADLPLSGTWQVKVTVKPDRFTEESTAVDIAIS